MQGRKFLEPLRLFVAGKLTMRRMNFETIIYFHKDWFTENDHDHLLVSARIKAHISCCAADQSIDIYSKTE